MSRPVGRHVKSPLLGILGLAVCVTALPAHAAYVSTGWLSALEIKMDNGKTYFTGGFTTTGNCLYNRLELRESGDYFGGIENAKRMYALILWARAQDKPIMLGYNDTDGPECRVTGVDIEW